MNVLVMYICVSAASILLQSRFPSTSLQANQWNVFGLTAHVFSLSFDC